MQPALEPNTEVLIRARIVEASVTGRLYFCTTDPPDLQVFLVPIEAILPRSVVNDARHHATQADTIERLQRELREATERLQRKHDENAELRARCERREAAHD